MFLSGRYIKGHDKPFLLHSEYFEYLGNLNLAQKGLFPFSWHKLCMSAGLEPFHSGRTEPCRGGENSPSRDPSLPSPQLLGLCWQEGACGCRQCWVLSYPNSPSGHLHGTESLPREGISLRCPRGSCQASEGRAERENSAHRRGVPGAMHCSCPTSQSQGCGVTWARPSQIPLGQFRRCPGCWLLCQTPQALPLIGSEWGRSFILMEKHKALLVPICPSLSLRQKFQQFDDYQ